jgi:hypothetical protein
MMFLDKNFNTIFFHCESILYEKLDLGKRDKRGELCRGVFLQRKHGGGG